MVSCRLYEVGTFHEQTNSQFVKSFRLLNIGTAKCVAVTIVLTLGVYHSVLHATYGVTPCKGLLKHGMYKVMYVR